MSDGCGEGVQRCFFRDGTTWPTWILVTRLCNPGYSTTHLSHFFQWKQSQPQSEDTRADNQSIRSILPPSQTKVTSDTNTEYVPFLELSSRPRSAPTFPGISWEPLKEVDVVDRGMTANPEKKHLPSLASKVITLTLDGTARH